MARWSGVSSRYLIRYADGSEVTVKTGIADALRWESNHNGKSLIGTPTLTAMLETVWYALRRQGLSDVKRFEDWSLGVADFAQLDDSEGDGEVLPDPSRPGQSDD